MKHGIIAILPLAAGAAVYGFAFGLLAAQVGFPWWGVALMSSLVHAGSSQIVAVRSILEDRFPGKVSEHDPFTSVAAGLALAGFHGYQFDNSDPRA
jgi:hypothetical protein